MTPKKARWLMRRPWYTKWRIRKLKRQLGYWEQMFIEGLDSGYLCGQNMQRVVKKMDWYLHLNQ